MERDLMVMIWHIAEVSKGLNQTDLVGDMKRQSCEPRGILLKRAPDRMRSNDLLRLCNMQISLTVENKRSKQKERCA